MAESLSAESLASDALRQDTLRRLKLHPYKGFAEIYHCLDSIAERLGVVERAIAPPDGETQSPKSELKYPEPPGRMNPHYSYKNFQPSADTARKALAMVYEWMETISRRIVEVRGSGPAHNENPLVQTIDQISLFLLDKNVLGSRAGVGAAREKSRKLADQFLAAFRQVSEAIERDKLNRSWGQSDSRPQPARASHVALQSDKHSISEADLNSDPNDPTVPLLPDADVLARGRRKIKGRFNAGAVSEAVQAVFDLNPQLEFSIEQMAKIIGCSVGYLSKKCAAWRRRMDKKNCEKQTDEPAASIAARPLSRAILHCKEGETEQPLNGMILREDAQRHFLELATPEQRAAFEAASDDDRQLLIEAAADELASSNDGHS